MYFNSQGTRQDFNTTSNSSLIHLVLVAGIQFWWCGGKLVFNADNFISMQKIDTVYIGSKGFKVLHFVETDLCVKTNIDYLKKLN